MQRSGGGGQPDSKTQAMQDAQILASGSASDAMKAHAAADLHVLWRQDPHTVNNVLGPLNFSFDPRTGQLMYHQGNNWVPANWSAGPSASMSAGMGPGTQWSQALQQVQKQAGIQKQTDQATGAGIPGGSGAMNPNLATYGSPMSTGGGTGVVSNASTGLSSGTPNAASSQGGAGADPQDYKSGQYANTFFGSVDPNAIDELAGSPAAAWSLYKTQGGPGGGSLQNSMLGRFGQNNFQSLMGLAPYLNDQGSLPADTLNFAGQGMGQNMQGGGQYMDPSKILNAAFSRIGSDPSVANQETAVQDVLNQIAPYMDPTEYKMLQNRVNDVLDQYMTYGLQAQNSGKDLSGVLLKQIQNAIGQGI